MDTDAICALYILEELLKRDNILYKLYPISGFRDMNETLKSL